MPDETVPDDVNPPACNPPPDDVATSDRSLSAALAALCEHVVGDATLEQTLARVAELARSTVQHSDQVGVTLLDDRGTATFASTDPVVAELDRAQHEIGDGPWLAAHATGQVVVVPSTKSSDGSSEFRRLASRSGFASVVSFPLSTETDRIGAITHYSTIDEAFGVSEIEVGTDFAQQAASVLANAQAYWDARRESEHLAKAMESRATIEQAKGVIIATMNVDADEAFDVLRVRSQHENIKVRELAADIVQHHVGDAEHQPG